MDPSPPKANKTAKSNPIGVDFRRKAATTAKAKVPATQRTYTTHSLMRKMAHKKKSAWIMFIGDSNMRHSYWWWVTNKLNTTDANVQIIKSKQFSKGDEKEKRGAQWSDQEAVVEYPDGFQLRTSFRFLHGSAH